MGRFSDERWRAHKEVHRIERRALNVAFKELQRRLRVLNHAERLAAARDKVVRETYVRNDVWQGDQQRLEEQVRLLALDLTELRSSGGSAQKTEERAQQSSRALIAICISAAALIVTIIGLVLLATHHG